MAGAALANDSRLEEEDGIVRPVGDPTETALLEAARRLGVHLAALNEAFPRVAELPFDSDRKRMTTFHRPGPGAEAWRPASPGWEPSSRGPRARPTWCWSGAGSCSLPAGCARWRTRTARRIAEANQRLAAQALRVLAVACRGWPAVPEPLDAEAAEQELIFVGLVGMIDPPRPEAAESIREAKRAGIRTIMVTGDHAATAAAIAARLGLVEPGQQVQVVSGRELDAMDDETLRKRCRTVSVFARVSPSTSSASCGRSKPTGPWWP